VRKKRAERAYGRWQRREARRLTIEKYAVQIRRETRRRAATEARRSQRSNLQAAVVVPARTVRPRVSRSRTTRRARAPGRSRSSDDDPHDLAARLAGLIGEHGPSSACWLAAEVGRRKSSILAALHLGPFVQVGKGRAARWTNQRAPVASEPYRNAVWKARRLGAIDAVEALELLLEPKPLVHAMLAEVAA
jgi:hypothetical protein